jgi:hypothetical protein
MGSARLKETNLAELVSTLTPPVASTRAGVLCPDVEGWRALRGKDEPAGCDGAQRKVV